MCESRRVLSIYSAAVWCCCDANKRANAVVLAWRIAYATAVFCDFPPLCRYYAGGSSIGIYKTRRVRDTSRVERYLHMKGMILMRRHQARVAYAMKGCEDYYPSLPHCYVTCFEGLLVLRWWVVCED